MIEIAIVAGLFVAIGGLSALALVPVMTLIWTGSVVMGVGFVFGTSTALVYHLRLYRTLEARGDIPRDWIWKPHHHHTSLTETEKAYVLPWWFMGGAGFVLVVLGGVVGGVGVVKMFFENASSLY